MDFLLMLAKGAEGGNGGEGGGWMSILTLGVPMILMFVVMYFVMIRPQKKQEKGLDKARMQCYNA